MKMRLPEDFKTYTRNRVIGRLIPWAILEIAVGALLIFFGKRIFHTEESNLYMLYYAVALLLPFAVTGFPLKLLDRSYLGKVLHVEAVTTVDSTRKYKPTVKSLYRKNTIYLTVQSPNGGSARRVKAYEESAKNPYVPAYAKGDLVFHLYGTRTVVRLPKSDSPDAEVQCAVCGDRNAQGDGVCRRCGRTLPGHSMIRQDGER